MSLRVVGSPPETFAISMFFQRPDCEDPVDLLERHVLLAIAALPVAAHLAARVADERAVEDQHRRMDRPKGRDGGVDQVAGRAGGGFERYFAAYV